MSRNLGSKCFYLLRKFKDMSSLDEMLIAAESRLDNDSSLLVSNANKFEKKDVKEMHLVGFIDYRSSGKVGFKD